MGISRALTRSLDLCYLAGEPPAGLLCELVCPDDPGGNMARRDDCWRFAKEWGLKMISVDQLVDYIQNEEGRGKIPDQ